MTAIIWEIIEMSTAKPLYVAAYYKSRYVDSQSASKLRRSLELAYSLKGNT